MLSGLDETLRHQLPTTFDHVGTSDPRFYDRYWFCCYDPTGELAVIIGMGLDINMNVLDGFVGRDHSWGVRQAVAGTEREVRRPNGDRRERTHREAPARVTVNGRVGMGHQILLASGPVPFLGLD